jgi:hypothetical protein
MIPVRYLILEGPDCSGKTSLYSELHKTSSFKYNIHDRSFLSMLCYARLYGRDETEHRRNLEEELRNVNNYLVVLLPSESILVERLRDRGDEFQDDTSILRLRNIFEEEVERIQSLPNVLVMRHVFKLPIQASLVMRDLEKYANQTPKELGGSLRMWAQSSSNKETQLQVRFDLPLDHDEHDILDDPHEGIYYKEILKSCVDTIRNEISGINPYGKPQDTCSRRFFYSSDTCISSIHFMLRNNFLNVYCTLRSTDANKNGDIDLQFLSHISTHVPNLFGWSPKKIFLNVTFNSLHIRQDL